MTHAFAFVAALLYLLPVAVLIALRCRRDPQAWELATDIPFAVAADLLLLLLASRLMTLGTAVFVSRPLWLLGGYVVWRRPRNPAPAVGARLRAPDVVSVACAAALCFGSSAWLSRPYDMWDRPWHGALVASLRGQRSPFANVFEPNRHLHYHFPGDALAAVMQTLSFGTLHSSYALALAHDLMFALSGATIALLLIHVGYRSLAVTCGAALAVLMSGPVGVLRGAPGPSEEGYSVFNFFDLSFRPHVVLAGLLIIGTVATLLVRARAPSLVPLRRVAPALACCAALLAITDEASAAFLGLGLFAVWLVTPRVLHERRWVGLVMLVAVAAELGLAQLLFSGSLSPGGPVSQVHIVDARAPGFIGRAPFALSTDFGLRSLIFDVGPQVTLAMAVGVASLRRPTALALSVAAFVVSTTFASVMLLMKFEMAKGFTSSGEENHRFMTMVQLAAPLAMLFLAPSIPKGAAERVLAFGAILLSVHSTAAWVLKGAPGSAPPAATGSEMNCRDKVGSRPLERARPTYMAQPVLLSYLGCHPSFTPGAASKWDVKVEGAVTNRKGFDELDREMLTGGDSLRVVCPGVTSKPIPLVGTRPSAICVGRAEPWP